MAWRYDKESGDFIIDGWENGTAPDPYSGLGRMYEVNLSVPGEVSVGYPITANATSGATLGTPIADSTRLFTYGTPGIPTGSPQSFAILDASGRVWESTSITGTYAFLSSSNSTSGSTNQDGCAYWLGYLFKTRGANIDYWNGSTWSTGWKTTLTGSVKHFMYVGSDNVLYITNGNYLASITASSPTAFDPTSSGTYAFSVTKLQLPVTDLALSLCEVGGGNTPSSTLLVGGSMNAIYPWDKISSSYSLPIYIADSYIGKMVSVNQNAYIFPGNVSGRGRIYITNGSQANLYFKMPDYLFNIQDPYYEWGDAIFHRNNLIFGCFVDTNAGVVQTVAQVFAIDLDTKAFRSISSIPANATAKANATCLISTLNLTSPGFGYIVAWDDNGSAPGIGYSGTTAGVGSGVSIITDLMHIGTLLKLKTFNQVEVVFRTALASGESMTVTPVYDGGNVGTALTFTPALTSGALSGVANVTFQNNQWLQFQLAMVGNSASSGVRLKEIRIR
jgi:hypothetical protein